MSNQKSMSLQPQTYVTILLCVLLIAGSVYAYQLVDWTFVIFLQLITTLSTAGVFLTGIHFYYHQLDNQKRKTNMFFEIKMLLDKRMWLNSIMTDINSTTSDSIAANTEIYNLILEKQVEVVKSGLFNVDELMKISETIDRQTEHVNLHVHDDSP